MENYDYKKVLLVGNGFDINLGLRTSYGDYMQSKNFMMTKSGVPLLEYLEKQYQLHNWVDIESELKKYVTMIKIENVNMPFSRQHEILCNSLKNYLQNLDYNFVNERPTEAFNLLSDLIDDPVYVMNFNYTDTVSFICRTIFPKPQIHEVKMHGSFQKGIIFGIEDTANIPDEYIFLKKSTHPIFKPINFSERLSAAEEIIFFGYSLGESDHMYFKSFFEEQSHKNSVRKRMKIIIYHYGTESYFQIHSQLDKLTNKSITGLKQYNDVVFKNIKHQ